MIRRLPILVLLTAVVAASCTAESDTDLGSEGSAPDSVTEEFASASQSAPSGDPDMPADDVDDLRTLLFEPHGSDSDVTLHVRHEEILVKCMTDQGFEYVALVYWRPMSSPRFDSSLDPQEFARLYGYGVSTLFEAEELASAVVAATYVNPNELLRAEMSESEVAAYYEAFYGPPAIGIASEDSSYVPADSSAGCSGEAAAVYGGIQSLDISDEARTALLNIEQHVQSDAAVRSARSDWAMCMTAAGYDVASTNDIDALLDSWLTPALATGTTKTVTTTDTSGNSVTVTVLDPDAEALARAQQLEIDLAIADLDCDESAGLSETTAITREAAQERAISQWYGELSGSS